MEKGVPVRLRSTVNFNNSVWVEGWDTLFVRAAGLVAIGAFSTLQSNCFVLDLAKVKSTDDTDVLLRFPTDCGISRCVLS